MVDKRDAGVLSVHAVAGHAVVRKGLFSISTCLEGIGDWVLLLPVADKDMMLCEDRGLGLKFAGRVALQPARPTARMEAANNAAARTATPPRAV